MVVPNESTCESDFQKLVESKGPNYNPTMAGRIELYKKYSTLNGLLNTNNTTSTTSCKHYDCSNTSEIKCLSGNTPSNTSFNNTNLSCYTDVMMIKNELSGYCYTTFAITNNYDYF